MLKIIPKEMMGSYTQAWVRSLLFLVIFVSAGLAFYAALYNGNWACFEPPVELPAPMRTRPVPPPTNVSHILFGIGASARTWRYRHAYAELWWRPGLTRGFVWLDEEPTGAWPESSPPYRVSANSSRFGARASAARIASIAAEAYSAAAASDVRWLVMGDDDTVFFPENLAAVLGKYDHEQMWYIGGSSESVEQDLIHSYDMAFGGGGFAVTLPVAAALAPVMNRCLERYNHFYGSDERVRACLGEIGVSLTREPGFHQVDLRGNLYGMLAAHPRAALLSLHHLDSVEPINPHSGSRLKAISSLMQAYQLDPARTLAQTICYDHNRQWSISVAWGYSVQIYPRLLSAGELETPLCTFQTWRTRRDGPFTFSTRPLPDEPCERPIIYFLDHVTSIGGGATISEYSVARDSKAGVCERKDFAMAAKVRLVRVSAPAMDPNDWKKAPRRQCCEVKVRRAWWSWSPVMEVGVRPCRSGETAAMPLP